MDYLSSIRTHGDLPVRRDALGDVDLMYYRRRAEHLRSQLVWQWLGRAWARLRRPQERNSREYCTS